MAEPGPWCIEGVAAVRALRKALAARPGERPCDRVLYLTEPKAEQTRGQAAMGKGSDTVWREVAPMLRALGVEVSEGAAP